MRFLLRAMHGKRKMMRVLIISTVGLKYEGITSVILSNLQVMNLSGLKIYVAATMEVEPDIRNDLERLGCKVVDFPSRKKNTLSYILALARFVIKQKIEVIHVHGNSATMAIELLAAFMGGCKRRIVHSHNTCCDQIKADKLLRPIFNFMYTDAISCGNAAGKWLYADKEFLVLNNGRDIDKFKFSDQVREDIRKEFKIENEIVIGHVGGFLPQKNHEFLVEIYSAIHKMEPNTRFFMVGDGDLRNSIEQKVQRCGIKDCVIFTGITKRVAQLLQAMDGMILPSKFEGLPLVVIEWQIAALPCVVSTTVTRDCAITNLVEFCPLSADAYTWARTILEKIKNNNRGIETKDAISAVRECGFDIRENAEILRRLYLNLQHDGG
jgi:glycosyltransferase involved in cell wall biosynthesis